MRYCLCTDMLLCFSGGLLPRYTGRWRERRLERWRHCEWGRMGPVEIQHRRQLDRVGGNGPYHCRRSRRGKCRHRHCVAVNRILQSDMTHDIVVVNTLQETTMLTSMCTDEPLSDYIWKPRFSWDVCSRAFYKHIYMQIKRRTKNKRLKYT